MAQNENFTIDFVHRIEYHFDAQPRFRTDGGTAGRCELAQQLGN